MWRHRRRRDDARQVTSDANEVARALEEMQALDPTKSSSEVMDRRFAAALATARAGSNAHPPFAVAPLLLVLMAALLVGATYVIATATSQAQPGALGPAGALHCSGIADLAPPDAGRALAERGYRVSYRDERTTDDRFGVSRVTDIAPQGVITDIVVHDDLATVFVSRPDDPLAQQALDRNEC